MEPIPINDEPLSLASHAELVIALSYALRFDDRGRATRTAVEITAQIAAEALVRYLAQAGFVVMKRPPLKPHSLATGPDKKGPPL